MIVEHGLCFVPLPNQSLGVGPEVAGDCVCLESLSLSRVLLFNQKTTLIGGPGVRFESVSPPLLQK